MRQSGKWVFPFFFSLSQFLPTAPHVVSHSGGKAICPSITRHTGQGVWSVYRAQRDDVSVFQNLFLLCVIQLSLNRQVCVRESVSEHSEEIKCTFASTGRIKYLSKRSHLIAHQFLSLLLQTVCEREKKDRGGEKRNSSGDVHGIANHSSAETELPRFRERWCHPISTNEKPGEDKCIGKRKKHSEKEDQSGEKKEGTERRRNCIDRKTQREKSRGVSEEQREPNKGSVCAAF